MIYCAINRFYLLIYILRFFFFFFFFFLRFDPNLFFCLIFVEQSSFRDEYEMMMS